MLPGEEVEMNVVSSVS